MQITPAQQAETVHTLAIMLEQAQLARSVLAGNSASPQVQHVTVNKFCELTGYSPAAVDKKRRDGVWLEGEVWVKAKDGRVLISLEGYEAWVNAA